MCKKIILKIEITYITLNILILIYLYILLIFKYIYICRDKEIYIFNQSNDKRYIEYYSKITLSSNQENIPNLKFAYNIYEPFCYCKNNTKYRVYDKNLCLTSKECDSNFQISPKYYKVEYFSNWNNKQIYTSKQKYIFFQGINNLTGGCDKNFNYKKCGFLLDINSDFCIKDNEICPYEDTNITFYLKNLTNSIHILYENENIIINDKYKINNFFYFILKNKSINYEYVDSNDLYRIVIDNNIPYLKEIINEKMNNIKLYLVLNKLDNSNIKINDNTNIEKKVIITYTGLMYSFDNLILLLLYICFGVAIFMCFFSSIMYVRDKKYKYIDSLNMSFYFSCVSGILINSFIIYIFYYFKQNIEKENILNDEYYKTIKTTKFMIYSLIFIILSPAQNYIIILFHEYKIYEKCLKIFNKKKNTHFVEIQ